jgi:hypothetical protein
MVMTFSGKKLMVLVKTLVLCVVVIFVSKLCLKTRLIHRLAHISRAIKEIKLMPAGE